MCTSLLQLETLRAPLALRSGHPSGPSAEGTWHARTCDRQVLSHRSFRMPKNAFIPEVNA